MSHARIVLHIVCRQTAWGATRNNLLPKVNEYWPQDTNMHNTLSY